MTNIDQLSVKVLGMNNNDYYSAVALDTDIWGYGENLAEALEDLKQHLKMHVLYLKRTCKVELLHRPAPQEFQDMYNECFIAHVKGSTVPGWWIDHIPLPIDVPQQNLRLVSSCDLLPSPALRYTAGRCRRSAA